MGYIEKEDVFETIAESKEKVEKAFGRIGNGVIGIGPLSRKLIMQPLENLESAIAAIPAADVRPVIRAKWREGVYAGYRCPVCITTWDVPTNFCPNCGAKMEES